MVAPSRTPQARGVKCDLCKKILSSATWLDQTKPAKEVIEAQNVLSMIKQHNTTDCPCIPKNIENLLVGSTHFEIHRLVAKKLDDTVGAKQYESLIHAIKQKTQSANQNETILNDCHDCSRKESRFKIYRGYCCSNHVDSSKQQLKHLHRAIDYWQLAMEDQTHPFNAKLALRLGLTHHVIYACYLFKYYKIFDYQLITANLLLNVFRSIDGVTANAILHAYYLLIKSLIDCDQLQLARHHLKQAMKLKNYHDKSNYESILMNCVACELSFMDGRREGAHNILDELSDLVIIRTNDKLQHYYARTLAMSTILRYIHHYQPKSDHCFEFFHTFRYSCAMIRRCYESSFELVLAEKDLNKKHQTKDRSSSISTNQSQIPDHGWIRFAICDFVFNTFDLLTEFYSRAGMPECLELIYNGLNLISYRNGGVYWQSRILSIGARLDLLCDKYEAAKTKFDNLTRVVGHTDNSNLMNVIRLNSEIGMLEMINQQGSIICKDVIENLLDRIKTCKISLTDRVQHIELYDAKSNSFAKTASTCDISESVSIIIGGHLGKMSLTTLGIGITSHLRTYDHTNNQTATEYMFKLKKQLELIEDRVLEFYDCQMILEMLIRFTNLENSERMLLDALSSSHLFIEVDDDKMLDIQSQLSSLALQGDSTRNGNKNETSSQTTTTTTNKKGSRIPTSRRSKRKGFYEVAILSEKNSKQRPAVQMYNVLGTVANFETLTSEEIIVSYLRNSEPNPDYYFYRRAHELMLTFRLSDDHYDHESILYHMTESTTANTMRYRWMMFEEHSMSPFDQTTVIDTSNLKTTPLKHLGFCNVLVNQDNVIKSMIRNIPDDIRLVQLKYVLDKRVDLEHLLCVCIGGNNNEQIYIHTRRSLTSDDFYNDATILLQNENDTSTLTIANRMATKIDESKKSLLMRSNQRTTRSEIRQQIETDISIILHDLENEWLGPFRFLFCGKICDPSYNNLIQGLMVDLQSIMGDKKICRSIPALRMVLENASLLSRKEFCQIIAALFNCDPGAPEGRECFDRWLRCIESHMAEHNLGMNKTAYLKQLPRGQVGLILDDGLAMIPFESLLVVRVLGQGIFRVPSLRLFSIMSVRRCSPIKIDPNEVVYMLDPAHNLAKTRERFDNKLKSQTNWCGTIGHPPKTEELESWLSTKQLYIFIGHGAGTVYYNKLCKGRGLSALTHIECASIVMGCSSGRMLAEGPRLETFGIGWMFVFKGSPCYMGLLWDVTDCDIDKFLDALLDKWLPGSRRWSSGASENQQHPITDASTRARSVCQLKLLVGSTPVVYGLPIWCKE